MKEIMFYHGVLSDTYNRQELQARLDCVDKLYMTVDKQEIEVIPRWNVYKIIENMPSVESEQSNASEFWRKRADFYSDMCMNLVGEMEKGVKIKSVKIRENGIEFMKEQPSAQPYTEAVVIHNGDKTQMLVSQPTIVESEE